MPQISGSLYVPLTFAQLTEAAMYMQNLVRQGGMTDAQIVQATGERIPGTDQYDTLRLYSVLRQAHRAVGAAQQYANDPTRAPSLSDLPASPNWPENRGRVVTDIVIAITDPVTGETHTTRTEIVSDRPMSLDDLRSYVQEHARDYSRNRGGSLPAGWQDGAPSFTITVLDVSRGS